MNLCLFDRTGREIMVHDVLKVFHFVGPRRKKYYMYKWVVGTRQDINGHPYLVISHLDGSDDHYWLPLTNECRDDIEIVQGFSDDGTICFEDRPVHKELPT